VGSPSSLWRKRHFISLNTSVFIENLPSSERGRVRARAIQAKKLCAERVGSSIEWEHFNISGARELNNAMRMLLTSMKKIFPALKFRKFSLLPLRKTQGHPTVKRKLINKSTLFNEGDHGRVTWARKTRPRYPDVTDKRPGC